VALDKRERVIENMAVASAFGFLSLIVASIFLFVDSRAMGEERRLLAPAGSSLSMAGRAEDPCFDRAYKIQGDGSYALALNLRSSSGAAIVALRLSPKGELQELRLLGSCASRLSADSKMLLASFPSGDDALDRAADFVRTLAGGGSEARP
jgi:hypothetical protein